MVSEERAQDILARKRQSIEEKIMLSMYSETLSPEKEIQKIVG